MKKCLARIRVVACGLFPAMLCLVSTAQASSWTIAFNSYFGANAVNPGTPTPWATLTFSDLAPGMVQLAISNNPSLVPTAKLSDVYLNFNPSMNVGTLSLSLAASSGGFTAPTISTGEDAFMVNSDGKFDLHLQFSTGGGSSSTFGAGEYALFDITGPSGLDAADFDFLSSGGGSQSEAAGHLLGLGTGNGSAWIASGGDGTVPEPGVVTLVGVGLGILVLYQRRRM